MRSRPALPALVLALWLAGCAEVLQIPDPLPMPSTPTGRAGENRAETPEVTRVEPLPTPAAPRAATVGLPPPPPVSPVAGEPALLNLEQVSLASFAQLVFADVLKKNVNIDPQVLARKDLVTFRSGSPQSAAQLEAAAVLLLKSFGVAAIDVGGLVRVVPDNASLGNLPEIRRGAALPETPLPLRPVFYLVELQAVRQIDVMNWLRTLFGERVRAQEDPNRNALLLSGTPDNVKAALEAIRVLDQPMLVGGQSLAITPLHWSADELARRLIEVLTAQGYAVQPYGQTAVAGGVRYAVIVLPVPQINAVYVFARGEQVVKHIADLARSLDKPNERGIGRNVFTYAVKHKDAALLAETLQQLLQGAAARPAAAAAPAGQAGQATAAQARATNVVIDKSTNTLIFQGSQEEYSQIIALLQTLDRPSKAALIEVTVAEMSTDDSMQLGVEFSFSDGNGFGGTLGGLALGTAGFNYTVLNGAGGVRMKVNALASANRATILSTPRVLARNGETATIQVGQEVPIVTSQQSTTASGVNNEPNVLQTIQYRNTGVILRVKPVIHSGDQVDLDVSQEVSAAQTTSTGVNISPTFVTRKIDTKLTLRNGLTVMLGGLISGDTSSGDSGIPGLKDIPILGYLFSNKTQSGGRRELIVLITPYIINDSHEAESLTEAFRRTLGPWAARPGVPATTPPPSDASSALIPGPAAPTPPASTPQR